MHPAIAALDALDSTPPLANLDTKGRPPRSSRMTKASDARTLFVELLRDDEGSAQKRARVQANKDGEPPFDQGRLNASGQGSRTNTNFLLMQDRVNKAVNGYMDIIVTPKSLMTLDVEFGEASERAELAQIIAQELTRTIRKWKGFTYNFQRLVDLFVTHGVGIEHANDTIDFRFKVTGFGDFLIPRQTEASEDEILYAIARRDMTVTELYQKIENEEAATNLGWDVDATIKALHSATTESAKGGIGEVENFRQSIKNNDITADRKYQHVPLLYVWVREFDGSISFFITTKDGDGDEFLFKHENRYECAEDAFNFYCYGIGNGTYHGIRGMGHMIFALCQLHNRLMSQKADSVMLAEGLLLQTESANALQEASLNTIGGVGTLLSQGFEVIDRKFSASDLTLPFLGEVTSLMGQISSRFMAPSSTRGGDVYKSKDEVNAELEAAASGDSGAIDLFYLAWDRTLRRMCKRIVNGPKTDKLVGEFHKRVTKLGILPEMLKAIDYDSIYAFRTIGAGSPAARSIAFRQLMEILPQLDEIGRKNLIYQYVSNVVGHVNAQAFATSADEPRLGVEAGQAEIENVMLMQGSQVQVFPYQMHATHLQIHLPALMDTLEGVEIGTIDPMTSLDGLVAMLDHVGVHGEAIASDPTQDALYRQVKEVVNNTRQIVVNMQRKIKADVRQGMESGEVPQDGSMPPQEGQPDAKAAADARLKEIQVQTAEFKLQLSQALGQMKLAAEQAKHDQALALNDAKAANAIELKMRYPRTDFATRS